MRKKRRKNMHLTRQGITAVVALGVSFSIITGCANVLGSNAAPAVNEQQQSKAVKVAKLEKIKLGEPPELTAEIVSSVQFELFAKASGEVTEVLKRRGDTVNEGDVIARIYSKDADYERSKAAMAVQNASEAINTAKKEREITKAGLQNSILKAEQALHDLTRNTNKLKNDYDAGRINKTPVQEAEVKLKNAQLDLELLKQQLKTLNGQDNLSALNLQLKDAQMNVEKWNAALADLEIRASTSGILTEQTLEKGALTDGSKRIGVIQKMDPVKIKAFIPEAYVKAVREKTELTFNVPGTTEKVKGKVTYMSPVIDTQAKGYELNLEASNADLKLMPGTKTRVQLLDEQQQIALAVPVSSIVRKGEDTFVFVLNGDTAERRRVELGRMSQDELNQEVLVGVKEGEQLIVSGQNHLNDKDKVQLTP
ncbi:RND family efflux transporter, MFP subunit [Paenibacillus sp. UNCCL117]|uniref:efflux RND transporter periplasmic adaptor subunit n=1 Tax=unclassified Paenibacillus TaxID=185978 RepID=UPI000888D360|nr:MULTISPECIES: efflux RND transporter periplasmic adaptor subunit [unclassified Paenibacillus]SDC02801.1 RND family efflux transporter, MFP subunit [Paenibacillus sp. cl123]SFW36930.1 RND family efflux transporter, MFP subunit [Paenibacillus sp. UNCCL117]